MKGTPARIGRYEVVRELGRGGMGAVYEVRCPDLPRSLALKRLLPEGIATARALERFQREAEAMAKVHHPGVVAIHAVGVDRGAPFLVTDLVDGEAVADVLRRGPLEPRRAAQVVTDMADAVAALHAQGVLHRDVKPANVMLRADGSPVLLDFGLARESNADTLTATGAVVGTPAYMSPEQAEGEGKVGEPADVYGLGALLFSCLAARPPFSGASVVNVLLAVMKREPDWPSAPGPLLKILKRAMHKTPASRHGSAEELAADLRGFLAAKAPEKPVLPLVAAAVVSLVALVGLGVALSASDPQPPAPPDPKPGSEPDPVMEPAVDPYEGLEDLVGDAWFTAAREALLRAPLHAKAGATRERYLEWGLDHPRSLTPTPDGVVVEGVLRVYWLTNDRVLGVLAQRGAPLWSWNASQRRLEPILLAATPLGQNGVAIDRQGGRVFARGERHEVVRVGSRGEGLESFLKLPAATTVTQLSIDHANDRLAIGTERGFVYMADLNSGVVDGGRRYHDTAIEWLEFSPDGRWMVTTNKPLEHGEQSNVTVRDRDGATVKRFKVNGVRGLDLLPDSSGFVLAVALGQVTLYDWEAEVRHHFVLNPGSDVGRVTGGMAHTEVPRDLVLSPGGERLYSVSGSKASNTGELVVFDVATGRKLVEERVVDTSFLTVDVSPDGQRIVTSGTTDDGMSVELRDVDVPPLETSLAKTKTEVGSSTWREGFREVVALVPDHPRALALRKEFLEHTTKRPRRIEHDSLHGKTRRERVRWLDTDRLLVFCEDFRGPGKIGRIAVIPVKANDPGVPAWSKDTGWQIHDVLHDAQRSRLICGAEGGGLQWIPDAGGELQPLPDLPRDSGEAWTFALHPDGERFAVGTTKGHVFEYELRDAERDPVVFARVLGRNINALVYSLDGRWLAAGSQLAIANSGKRGVVYDTRTKRGQPFDVAAVAAIAAHPGGHGFVLVGEPSVVSAFEFAARPRARPYRYSKASPMGLPEAHSAAPTGAVYSPDGRWLYTVAGLRDRGETFGELHVWDTRTGKPVHEFPRDRKTLTALSLSPDGSHLVTAGVEDGGIPWFEVWEVDLPHKERKRRAPEDRGPGTTNPTPNRD